MLRHSFLCDASKLTRRRELLELVRRFFLQSQYIHLSLSFLWLVSGSCG